MISDNPALRLALFLGVLALMFAWETYRPARSWFDSRRKRIFFGIGLAAVNNVFMKLFIAAPFIAWTAYVDSQGWGLAKLMGLSGWVEIVATIVVFDFFDAIKHRWFHRIPFMWRFHRVHHTDKHLDVLTALRYHPGEMVISAIIKAGWLVVWGPSVVAFLAFEIALNLNSEFHHTNIDLGKWDKYINKVFVTPRYHAIHHTIARERGDQNFTTIFTFWDRLMGTHSSPQTTEVDLERLGTLQDADLNLWEVLKSPLISPNFNGNPDALGEVKMTVKEVMAEKYENALSAIREKKAVLVDVREQSEIDAEGMVQDALVAHYSEMKHSIDSLLERLRSYHADKRVYVYCAAGVRSGKVVSALQAMGFDSENLGGYRDCIEHGFTPEEQVRVKAGRGAVQPT